MTQVPTVFLIALIVIAYAGISHLYDWMIRRQYSEYSPVKFAITLGYAIITCTTIMLLSNLIVPTP